MICKNCERDFEGKFCNHCGQNSNTQRIDSQFFLSEILTNIFQVNRGILYTIKELFTRPGHSIRDFLKGKRKQHSKPLAFLFILSTIYVISTYLIGENTFLGDALAGMVEGFDAYDDDKNDYIFSNILSEGLKISSSILLVLLWFELLRKI